MEIDDTTDCSSCSESGSSSSGHVLSVMPSAPPISHHNPDTTTCLRDIHGVAFFAPRHRRFFDADGYEAFAEMTSDPQRLERAMHVISAIYVRRGDAFGQVDGAARLVREELTLEEFNAFFSYRLLPLCTDAAGPASDSIEPNPEDGYTSTLASGVVNVIGRIPFASIVAPSWLEEGDNVLAVPLVCNTVTRFSIMAEGSAYAQPPTGIVHHPAPLRWSSNPVYRYTCISQDYFDLSEVHDMKEKRTYPFCHPLGHAAHTRPFWMRYLSVNGMLSFVRPVVRLETWFEGAPETLPVAPPLAELITPLLVAPLLPGQERALVEYWQRERVLVPVTLPVRLRTAFDMSHDAARLGFAVVDPMGQGKTLTVLAHILSDTVPFDERIAHARRLLRETQHTYNLGYTMSDLDTAMMPGTLWVTNRGLIHQALKELGKFFDKDRLAIVGTMFKDVREAFRGVAIAPRSAVLNAPGILSDWRATGRRIILVASTADDKFLLMNRDILKMVDLVIADTALVSRSLSDGTGATCGRLSRMMPHFYRMVTDECEAVSPRNPRAFVYNYPRIKSVFTIYMRARATDFEVLMGLCPSVNHSGKDGLLRERFWITNWVDRMSAGCLGHVQLQPLLHYFVHYRLDHDEHLLLDWLTHTGKMGEDELVERVAFLRLKKDDSSANYSAAAQIESTVREARQIVQEIDDWSRDVVAFFLVTVPSLIQHMFSGQPELALRFRELGQWWAVECARFPSLDELARTVDMSLPSAFMAAADLPAMLTIGEYAAALGRNGLLAEAPAELVTGIREMMALWGDGRVPFRPMVPMLRAICPGVAVLVGLLLDQVLATAPDSRFQQRSEAAERIRMLSTCSETVGRLQWAEALRDEEHGQRCHVSNRLLASGTRLVMLSCGHILIDEEYSRWASFLRSAPYKLTRAPCPACGSTVMLDNPVRMRLPDPDQRTSLAARTLRPMTSYERMIRQWGTTPALVVEICRGILAANRTYSILVFAPDQAASVVAHKALTAGSIQSTIVRGESREFVFKKRDPATGHIISTETRDIMVQRPVTKQLSLSIADISVRILDMSSENSGLDLNMASHVVFMAPVPLSRLAEVEKQAKARVHRLGQRFPVRVISLVAQGTPAERQYDARRWGNKTVAFRGVGKTGLRGEEMELLVRELREPPPSVSVLPLGPVTARALTQQMPGLALPNVTKLDLFLVRD